MMRRSWFFGVVSLVLLTILFALVCSSCGKSAVTPDGAPESGTEEQSGLVYEYITEDGKTVGRVGYDANGALVFREDYDFLGRVVKTSSFNTDGTEASVTEYVFLDGGNIPDHYTSTRYEYSGGALSGYSVASYHMEGIPDSVYEYGAEDELLGATLYEYNEAGVVISETHINSKNVKSSITEYEYDDDGRIAKYIYKSGSGEPASYTEITYNESGLIERESNYDADGNMTSYIEYEYDENGKNTGTYEYGPDENGEFVPIF